MVRHFGSQWIVSDDDKYKKIMSDMEWVFRRSYDFTSRKYYLRDELIRFAMQSCSITYRNHCKDILSTLGAECHEVYSGALIENGNRKPTRVSRATIAITRRASS